MFNSCNCSNGRNSRKRELLVVSVIYFVSLVKLEKG